MKIRAVEADLFREDRRTDITKVKSGFSKFYECAYKCRHSCYLFPSTDLTQNTLSIGQSTPHCCQHGGRRHSCWNGVRLLEYSFFYWTPTLISIRILSLHLHILNVFTPVIFWRLVLLAKVGKYIMGNGSTGTF